MKVTRVEGARVETEEEPRATCVNGTPREEPELTGDDGGGSHESVVIEESQVPSEDVRVRRENVTRVESLIRGSRKSFTLSKERESGRAVQGDDAWRRRAR